MIVMTSYYALVLMAVIRFSDRLCYLWLYTPRVSAVILSFSFLRFDSIFFPLMTATYLTSNTKWWFSVALYGNALKMVMVTLND